MSKLQRVILVVLLGIGIGGMSAYSAIQRNDIYFQAHPIAGFLGSITPAILLMPFMYWISGRIGGVRRGRAIENDLYARAWSECHENTTERDKGLWARAYSEMEGDEKKAVAYYVKLRVAQLANEHPKVVQRSDNQVPRSPENQCDDERKMDNILLTGAACFFFVVVLLLRGCQ